MFVLLPLLRENEAPGCPNQRALEIDFIVLTGAGNARDLSGFSPPISTEKTNKKSGVEVWRGGLG